jgi:hypothetical protein
MNQPGPDPASTLTPVRQALLNLHKALIERARADYEKVNGAVSPAEMLRLLIGDGRFSWLQPISTLIVRVDELISNANERRRPNAARPAITPEQAAAESAALLRETRELLSRDEAPGDFHERYNAALQRDPAIVLMHQAVMESLDRV